MCESLEDHSVSFIEYYIQPRLPLKKVQAASTTGKK